MDTDDDDIVVLSSTFSENERQKMENQDFTCISAVETLHSSGGDLQAMKTWIYPTNYPVRDYQFNIVKQSLFQNTLVCLPTGLGKTFIAAVLMYNYYRWFPTSKIIFMAPTKPLVSQQIEACFNIMGIPQEHTAEMTGNKVPKTRQKLWQNQRIIFLTPHVLVNDLARGICPARSIKLVVVDEAHKALGDYAYCHVIKQLKEQNYEFRVLALSATPGSDILAVQQVISNLLISHIEMRNEESIDIQEYTHHRSLEKVVVKIEGEIEDIKAKFFQIVRPYVQRLLDKNLIPSRNEHTLTKFMILKSREAFRQNPPMGMSHNIRGVLEGSFALCLTLYHALDLLIMHGIRSFYNFLKGKIEDKSNISSRGELLRNQIFVDLMDSLAKQYDNTLNSKDQHDDLGKSTLIASHPKIYKLKQIVIEHFEQFKKDNLSTRVMIFSQYRDSVAEIAEQLGCCGPLVKPMSFIGQSSMVRGRKGFSQNEQLRVVKKFKEGGFNTLISTCVGEEGLDIGEVDLIICYDVLKSPIRLVQRMGRTGRKREGRIVVLISEGREEQLFLQSHFKKKSLFNALTNGNKLARHLYAGNARMIPPDINPVCMKMMMAIRDWKNSTSKKKSHNPKKSIASYFDPMATGSKASLKKSGHFLNSEEEDWYKKNLKLDENEENKVKHVPMSSMSSFSSRREIEECPDISSNIVDFGKYQPWQTTLQPCVKISHSLQSRHLVELTEFIDMQVCLGANNDFYESELASLVDMSFFDVLAPEDDQIGGRKRKRAKTQNIPSSKKKTKQILNAKNSKKARKGQSSNLAKSSAENSTFDSIEITECIDSVAFVETEDTSDKISKDTKFSTSHSSPSHFGDLDDVFNYITPQKDSFLYIKQPPALTPSKEMPFISHRSLITFVLDFNDKLKNRWNWKIESLFYSSSLNNKRKEPEKSNNLSSTGFNINQTKNKSANFSFSGNSLSSIAKDSKKIWNKNRDEITKEICESKQSAKMDHIFNKKPREDNISDSFDSFSVYSNRKIRPVSTQRTSPQKGHSCSKESEVEVSLKHQRTEMEVSPIIRRKLSSQVYTSTPVPRNARRLFSIRTDFTPIQKDNSLPSSPQAASLSQESKTCPSPSMHQLEKVNNSEGSNVNINFNLSCEDLFADSDSCNLKEEANVANKSHSAAHQSSIIIEPHKNSDLDKISVKPTSSNTVLTETQVLDFLDQPTPFTKKTPRQSFLASNSSTSKASLTHLKEIPAIKNNPAYDESGTSQPDTSYSDRPTLKHKNRVHRNLSNEFITHSSQNNSERFKDELSECLDMNSEAKKESIDQGWINCRVRSKGSLLPNNANSLRNDKAGNSNTNLVSFDIGLIDFEDWSDDAFKNNEIVTKCGIEPDNISENTPNNKLDFFQKEKNSNALSSGRLESSTFKGDSGIQQKYVNVKKGKCSVKDSSFSHDIDIEEAERDSVITLDDSSSPIRFKRKVNGIVILSDDESGSHSTTKSSTTNPGSDIKSKRPKWPSHSTSLSDDDFKSPCSKEVKHVRKRKPNKRKKKNVFIDLEADVSVADGRRPSTDESESDLDCLDESFVDDLTQPTQQESNMKAMYLQSVRSPPKKIILVGNAALDDKCPLIEASDGSLQEDEEDSFVVDNDFVEYETEYMGDSLLAEDPIVNKVLLDEGKMKFSPPIRKKRRRIISTDSNVEDEIELEPKVVKLETQSVKTHSPKEKAEGVNFDFGLGLLVDNENDWLSMNDSSSRTAANEIAIKSPSNAPSKKTGNCNKISSPNINDTPSLLVNSAEKTDSCKQKSTMAAIERSCSSRDSLVERNARDSKAHFNSVASSKGFISSELSKERSTHPKTIIRPRSLLDFNHEMTSNPSISESPLVSSSKKKTLKKFGTEPIRINPAKGIPNMEYDDDFDFKDSIQFNITSSSKVQNPDNVNNSLSNETLTNSGLLTSTQSNSSLPPESSIQGELCVLVDSCEVSTAGLITSKLRMVHGFKILITQLVPASYVLSSRMAVYRQSYTNFVDSKNRESLVERIQGLLKLYERPVVIVEIDSGLSLSSIRRSFYADTIACACAQLPQLKVLQAANRDETTHLLQKLIHSERNKGHAIPPIQEETAVMKFYRKFPKVSCASAIFLSKNYFSISDFLQSSAEDLMKKGRLSRCQAAAVLSHIGRHFRKDMLPPSRLRKSSASEF